ncbi:ROK family transcriptional regulator [Actinotalea sp. M2MS4P-6]|uniref:ROK family transcriptional regulator n=1 Tax=Actinotalea sp. M2MS4P-6 TaxID=2983762 RepID=UPI0021E45635|nr:ROK family transcriptional regulator [Actinotalea sp. M2MS4P-6]MCV2394386.1 ROK family transcriptional regulator [Actinotalea sp. M2MS4P-6]
MDGDRGGTSGDLVEILRDGRTRTRTELAAMTGQTRATISQRLDPLQRLGLVGTAQAQASTGGRPSAAYEFKPEARVVLVADLGVRHATLALTDLAGTPIATTVIDIQIADGPDVVMPEVVAAMDQLVASVGSGRTVAGVGVGIPGPVEHSTGRPTSPPIMPGWDRYDIVEALSAHYGARIFVDNDANLGALGEQTVAYPDLDELLYIRVASGVGAGIITGGRLVHGVQGAAGDLGHVFSQAAAGRQCRCGNTGCVETVAGGIGIAQLLSEAGVRADNADDVTELARAGDLEAIRALRLAGQALGEVLATCIALLNPRLIALGGELATAGESLISGVRQVVFARTLPLASRDLEVVLAKGGALGGAIGAARLVLDNVLDADSINAEVAALAAPVG